MSAELRLKKLRGSGGSILAKVTDEQQSKGNLGGPDLFLAPIGRLDASKISKYTCNTCEKEFDGSPKIDFENPNEEVAENLSHRDLMDSTREHSPLKQAEDALVLDNTDLNQEEQFNIALNWAKERIMA